MFTSRRSDLCTFVRLHGSSPDRILWKSRMPRHVTWPQHLVSLIYAFNTVLFVAFSTGREVPKMVLVPRRKKCTNILQVICNVISPSRLPFAPAWGTKLRRSLWGKLVSILSMGLWIGSRCNFDLFCVATSWHSGDTDHLGFCYLLLYFISSTGC